MLVRGCGTRRGDRKIPSKGEGAVTNKCQIPNEKVRPCNYHRTTRILLDITDNYYISRPKKEGTRSQAAAIAQNREERLSDSERAVKERGQIRHSAIHRGIRSWPRISAAFGVGARGSCSSVLGRCNLLFQRAKTLKVPVVAPSAPALAS